MVGMRTEIDYALGGIIWLVGFMVGFAICGIVQTMRPDTPTSKLTLTDGVVCISGNAETGPHWLVRADGWCYAADNPQLRPVDPRFGR